jgi:carbonic anhydrase/acetyltransferase-like protein (isoleucine patch superfamily)
VAVFALGEVEPRIDPTAYVHPDAMVIGDVVLGPDASVWPFAVLRGDDGAIRIGARSNVQDGAVIHCTETLDTVVGDDVTIGHQAHLEGCTILDGSLIGVGSIVLHEAVVGPNALVGANAVVTGRTVVPENAMALGVPAKISENVVQPGHNRDNAELYVARGRRYREQLRRLD